MSRYLTHVTLATGHSVQQARNSVSQATMDTLRPLLQRALAGEVVSIPNIPGATMTATAFGAKSLITRLSIAGTAILTTGIALKSRSAARLWEELLLVTPDDIPAPSQPPVPWIADALHPEAIKHIRALSWTGDYSRCIGWTWADMQGQQHDT